MELPYTDKVCGFISLTKIVTEDTIDAHDASHLDPRFKEWFDSIKVVAKLRESDLTDKSYIIPELNMTDLRREIIDFIMQEPYDGDRRLRHSRAYLICQGAFLVLISCPKAISS